MLTWLLPFYEWTFDMDYKHLYIPHWYYKIGMWGVDVVDIKRDVLEQLPLFNLS